MFLFCLFGPQWVLLTNSFHASQRGSKEIIFFFVFPTVRALDNLPAYFNEKRIYLRSFLFCYRFHVVYLIMVIQGVGTLLPWNMFITAHAVSILFTKQKMVFLKSALFSYKTWNAFIYLVKKTVWKSKKKLLRLRRSGDCCGNSTSGS